MRAPAVVNLAEPVRPEFSIEINESVGSGGRRDPAPSFSGRGREDVNDFEIHVDKISGWVHYLIDFSTSYRQIACTIR